MLRIVQADTPELLAQAADLLRDFPPHQRRRYAAHLHIVERYFDDATYARELDELDVRYGAPDGCVIAAVEDGQVIGAVCLRRLDERTCEMKRLYVPPEHRRKGIAKALVAALLDAARDRGYRAMRLDTGSFMVEAIALYEGFGFRRIAAYYPMEELMEREFVFMERPL
jgi:ribosomal protein S18 acetylase RimI-like enzyme